MLFRLLGGLFSSVLCGLGHREERREERKKKKSVGSRVCCQECLPKVREDNHFRSLGL